MWDCEHCGQTNIISGVCPVCFTPRTSPGDVPAEEPSEPAKEEQPPAATSKSNWGR